MLLTEAVKRWYNLVKHNTSSLIWRSAYARSRWVTQEPGVVSHEAMATLTLRAAIDSLEDLDVTTVMKSHSVIVGRLDPVPITPPDKKASLAYLKKYATWNQFVGILTSLKVTKIEGELTETLHCIYFQATVETESSIRYKLGFWPCSDCACISVEPVD